jgi:hypothetical protein
MLADGWSMTVELRDGPFYRSYAYSNPDAYEGAAYEAANAIGEVHLMLDSLLAPQRNVQVVRGRLEIGWSDAEFVPCGSSEKWGTVGDVNSPEIEAVRQVLAANDTVTRVPRYAEMRGMQALPAEVKRWRSPFAKVFDVDEVLAVKGWDQKECRR